MERLFHIRTNRKTQICHGTQTFYRILQPSPVGLGCLFCLFKNQQRKCLLNQSGTVADHIKHPSLWNRTIRHFLPSLPVDWLKQLLLLLRWHSLSVNWFQSFTFKLCFFLLNSISFNIITKMPISSIQQPYLSAKFILNLDQIKNIKKSRYTDLLLFSCYRMSSHLTLSQDQHNDLGRETWSVTWWGDWDRGSHTALTYLHVIGPLIVVPPRVIYISTHNLAHICYRYTALEHLST